MFAMGFYKWASGRVGSPQTSFSCCMNFLIFEAVFLFFFSTVRSHFFKTARLFCAKQQI